MSFVNADINPDPTLLQDTGIDSINATLAANGYQGWAANDPALAVILLGVFAQLLADLMNLAATMVPALFRAYGTQLLGVLYGNPEPASVFSTWTFTSPAPTGGYLIQAGTSVIIDGFAFNVLNDYVTGEGDTSAVVLLQASQAGTAYNGLGGINALVTPNQEIDWVAGIVTQGFTSGGADPESNEEYQNRLSAELKLQAPRPVVSDDFAAMLLSDMAEQATGVAVGRASSLDGYFPDARLLSTGANPNSSKHYCYLVAGDTHVFYTRTTAFRVPNPGAEVSGTGVPSGTTVASYPPPNDIEFWLSQPATDTINGQLTFAAMSGYGPEHLSMTGEITDGDPTVTILTPPFVGSIPDIGARVTGDSIPQGATVAAEPPPTVDSFTITEAPTLSNDAETLVVSSWTQVPLANTTVVTDLDGNALIPAALDALQAWIDGYRPQNWLVYVTSATYYLIYVNCWVKVLPDADPATTTAQVQQALMAWLNPKTWGSRKIDANEWLNMTDGYDWIRYNKAIEVAGSVLGVDYVESLTMDFIPNPTAESDLYMIGPAPLPESQSSSISVVAAS